MRKWQTSWRPNANVWNFESVDIVDMIDHQMLLWVYQQAEVEQVGQVEVWREKTLCNYHEKRDVMPMLWRACSLQLGSNQNFSFSTFNRETINLCYLRNIYWTIVLQSIWKWIHNIFLALLLNSRVFKL